MISQVVMYLSLLSFLFMLKTKNSHDTIISGIFTILFALYFYGFVNSWIIGQESTFAVLWDSSRSGDIRLNINSSLKNYQMIFPFFVISLMAMFNNLFFKYESHKKNLSIYICLNFVCLIMLITAENFIQMTTFVFMTDIISQLLIKDVNASRGYAIYNLIADMGLFLVFALLRGNSVSLNLESFNIVSVSYQNFAAILILISLSIKLGFFIFHTYLLDLTSTKFHRLILIFYLSSPIVAIISLVKLSAFLHHFAYFDAFMNVFISLSLIWGGIGLVLINGLKSKSVYLNMMLLSIITKIAEPVSFTWNTHFSALLVLAFLFNICLYYMHYYSARETSLSSKFKGMNIAPLYIIAIIWVLITVAFSMELFSFYDNNNQYYILGFMSLFLFSAAYTFNQLFQTVRQQLYTSLYDKRPLVILSLSAFLASVVIYHNYYTYWIVAILSVSVFLIFLFPMRFIFKNVAGYEKLQQIDFFPKLYNLILFNPLRITSKTLTLFVDFMFFEKTLRSFVNAVSGFIIRIFRQLSRMGFIRYTAWILISLMIMFWFLLEGQF